MNSPPVWLRSQYRKVLQHNTTEISNQELAQNAVVFAPHQDDETLGCGATLIKKREAGANLAVVFMTDGRQSHANFLTPEELIPIRYAEALAACQSLGIECQAVHFLNYVDSKLNEKVADAIPDVTHLLETYNPGAVFIPYHEDLLADHITTNQIVRAALKKWGRKMMVYEYPVWSWFHWPWVSVLQQNRQMTKIAVKNSIKFRAGLRILNDFKYAVNIIPLLQQKKTALDLYRSQMIRLNSDPQWSTLKDVSNGEFIDCFFQAIEIFHRYDFVV